MGTITLASEPSRPRRWRISWIVPVIVLLGLIGSVYALRTWPSGQPVRHPVAVPASPAIEDKWGVRVSMVGVTADGGMVDVRFTVVDTDKALEMFTGTRNLPVLVAEDSGMVLNSTSQMAHKHTLRPGETYFLLYRNTRGAIKSGTPVTLAFKTMRLKHVTAE